MNDRRIPALPMRVHLNAKDPCSRWIRLDTTEGALELRLCGEGAGYPRHGRARAAVKLDVKQLRELKRAITLAIDEIKEQE